MTLTVKHSTAAAGGEPADPSLLGSADWNADHTVAGGSDLTSVSDSNVTIALGGTPSGALLNPVSITAGWSGTLPASRLNANVVQVVADDTNVTGSIAAQNLTLGWSGTLAAGRLNANVVQAVTNDTNVTGSIAAQDLTLGWTGTLAAGRLNANVVQAVTNDTNVTGTIAAQGLTLGWSGTLALARGGLGASQASATVNQIPVYPGSGGGAAPTGISTWLDAALSSTIGEFLVRASGGWVAAAMPYANPVWWGADPTGTIDSAAAINSAVAASLDVRLPPGTFKILSAVAINNPGQRICGANKIATVVSLGVNTQNGFVFAVGADRAVICNMSISAGVTKTAGSGVLLQGIDQYVEHMVFNNQYIGVQAASTTLAVIRDCIINASVTDGIQVIGNSTTGPLIVNNTVGGSLAHGITILNAGGFYLDRNTVISNATGLLIESGTGVSRMTFGYMSNNSFDSSTLDNADITTNNTVPIQNIVSVNDQFGTAGAVGLNINGNSGAVSGVSLINAQFVNNGTYGLLVQGTWDHINVTSPQITGNGVSLANTYSGILFQGTGTHCQVIGGYSQPQGAFGNTQKYGIDIAAAGVDYCIIKNVDVVGNGTAAIHNISTAANNIIESNPGYNPVGISAAANVGASAATITAGPSPETHYLNQSATNTATVTKGGQSVAALKDPSTYYVIDLAPNESYVVTWATTQPTYTKHIH